MTKLNPYLLAGAALLLTGLGFFGGWLVFHPVEQTIIEKAAPAQTLPGGSTVIERAPTVAEPSKQAAQDAKNLNKHAQVEREISIDIQPKPPTSKPEDKAVPVACEPVHLDIDLVKLPDLSHRVIVKAQGGDIIKAIDVPVLGSVTVQKQFKWSVGAVYDIDHKQYGAYVERDVGRLRIGYEAIRTNTTPGDHGITQIAKVGWRF